MLTRNMDFRLLLIRAVAALSLSAVILAGCSEDDPFDGELGLMSRLVELPAETGITPVIVYSNTCWHVHFTSEVDWAGLDRLSDEGSSQVKLAYAANYGRARKVALAFEAGSTRDTVVMIQASGLKTPVLAFGVQTLTASASESNCTVPVETNLRDDFEDIVCSVEYISGGEGWISGMTLSASDISFKMTSNASAEARFAKVILSHTDAYDSSLTAILYVTQNPA